MRQIPQIANMQVPQIANMQVPQIANMQVPQIVNMQVPQIANMQLPQIVNMQLPHGVLVLWNIFPNIEHLFAMTGTQNTYPWQQLRHEHSCKACGGKNFITMATK